MVFVYELAGQFHFYKFQIVSQEAVIATASAQLTNILPMNIITWVVGILIGLLAAYMGLLVVIPSDVVASRYATLNDARGDELFERGWLPDILPASSHSIRTENNLDHNTSVGEFSFSPPDYAAFASRLRPYDSSSETISPDQKTEVQKMQRRGFQPGLFVEDNSSWLFFCQTERGYCEYIMWLRKG